jgi:hypothetical protein
METSDGIPDTQKSPGRTSSSQSRSDPGAIPGRGNPSEEAARFQTEGDREERRGETFSE